MKKVIGIFICMLLSAIIFSSSGAPYNLKLIPSDASIESGFNPYIALMINQVNESVVFNYVKELVEIGPRYTGTENCNLSAQYIYGEFKKMDLWVQFDYWEFGGFSSQNVVATLNGTDLTSNAIFIVGAHYDTICKIGYNITDSPGATDNGVGVATVLASAKIMSQHSFNHTVRFIAFSGEENGLFGSYSYAKKAYERGDNIVAALNVDENGYASDENGSILLAQTARVADWLSVLSATMCTVYKDVIGLSIVPTPYYPYSDHASFHNYGYAAIFYLSMDWDTPWMHTPYDTLDKINKPYHVKSTKLILATLAELASNPIEVQVVITNPSEGYLYFFGTPVSPIEQWRKKVVPTILLGAATVSVDVVSNDDIEWVAFYSDDNLRSVDYDPPYEWTIRGFRTAIGYFPIVGTLRVTISAYTATGNLAMDEMDLTVFAL